MDLCLSHYRMLVSNEYDTLDLSLLNKLSGVCEVLKVENVIYIP